MDEIIINSAHELLTHLDLYDEITMFRGQASANWPLVPSIARMHEHLEWYEDWGIFEEDLLERFQKRALPFLDRKPVNKYEWLVIAQHHGLPTRLLDWTTNPLKGLFFAVENPNNPDTGVLWQLDPGGWWNDLVKLGEMLDVVGMLGAYFPDHLNPRIIAQESCFTVFPLPSEKQAIPALSSEGAYSKHITRIIKYVIPEKSKRRIRIELRKLGITHASLYPGLDGLATNIRREFELNW